MNEEYPEALRLAQDLESYPGEDDARLFKVAAELRRLHKEVQRLEAELDDIHYQNSMND